MEDYPRDLMEFEVRFATEQACRDKIGQSAATILTENIVSIWARMLPGSVRNAVWLAHPSTLPQLLTLSLSVGTGGSVVDHLVRGADGAMTLLGRPLLLTEHCSPVGTVGDIVLADLSFYAVAMRTDVRIDVSTAPHFMSDELAVRDRSPGLRLDTPTNRGRRHHTGGLSASMARWRANGRSAGNSWAGNRR